MSRIADLVRFYTLVDRLKQRVGGTRTLASLGSFRDWPNRGVYLFFEPSETRSDSGEGPRIVRVGTHGLNQGRRSTLAGASDSIAAEYPAAATIVVQFFACSSAKHCWHGETSHTAALGV